MFSASIDTLRVRPNTVVRLASSALGTVPCVHFAQLDRLLGRRCTQRRYTFRGERLPLADRLCRIEAPVGMSAKCRGISFALHVASQRVVAIASVLGPAAVRREHGRPRAGGKYTPRLLNTPHFIVQASCRSRETQVLAQNPPWTNFTAS